MQVILKNFASDRWIIVRDSARFRFALSFEHRRATAVVFKWPRKAQLPAT